MKLSREKTLRRTEHIMARMAWTLHVYNTLQIHKYLKTGDFMKFLKLMSISESPAIYLSRSFIKQRFQKNSQLSFAACYIGSMLEWLGRSYKNLEKCRQLKKKSKHKARYEPVTFCSTHMQEPQPLHHYCHCCCQSLFPPFHLKSRDLPC